MLMILVLLTHTKVLARIVVDDATSLLTIEASWTDDELRHIERKETVTIETARILLWQHKRLAYIALCIDMTEIRARDEAIVTT